MHLLNQNILFVIGTDCTHACYSTGISSIIYLAQEKKKKGSMKTFLVLSSMHYLSFLWFSTTLSVSVNMLKTWWINDTFYSFVLGATMHHTEPPAGLSNILSAAGRRLQTALKCHPSLRIVLLEQPNLAQGHTPFPAACINDWFKCWNEHQAPFLRKRTTPKCHMNLRVPRRSAAKHIFEITSPETPSPA